MDIQSALFSVVEGLKGDLVTSLQNANRVASGDTINAIESRADETSAQLLGPQYLYALQDGRKPTSPDAPAGDPTLFQQIQKWCAAKGIDQKAAYPITKSIHENGYPGTPGIIDEPLSDENVDKYLLKCLGDLSGLFVNEVSNQMELA